MQKFIKYHPPRIIRFLDSFHHPVVSGCRIEYGVIVKKIKRSPQVMAQEVTLEACNVRHRVNGAETSG